MGTTNLLSATPVAERPVLLYNVLNLPEQTTTPEYGGGGWITRAFGSRPSGHRKRRSFATTSVAARSNQVVRPHTNLPRTVPVHHTAKRNNFYLVEGGGFEPPKLSRQIYSLIPLATREPLRKAAHFPDVAGVCQPKKS